jgi:3-deoxy-7-phosphoheptulonate synthase
VAPVSNAAIAAGADGLIIEVHNQPNEALSDGDQSLYLDQLGDLLPQLSGQARLRNKRFDFESAVAVENLQ